MHINVIRFNFKVCIYSKAVTIMLTMKIIQLNWIKNEIASHLFGDKWNWQRCKNEYKQTSWLNVVIRCFTHFFMTDDVYDFIKAVEGRLPRRTSPFAVSRGSVAADSTRYWHSPWRAVGGRPWRRRCRTALWQDSFSGFLSVALYVNTKFNLKTECWWTWNR